MRALYFVCSCAMLAVGLFGCGGGGGGGGGGSTSQSQSSSPAGASTPTPTVPASAWTTSVSFGTTYGGFPPFGQSLASANDGQAYFVFGEYQNSTTTSLRLFHKPSVSPWENGLTLAGPITEVSANTRRYLGPVVRVDTTGNALALWTYQDTQDPSDRNFTSQLFFSRRDTVGGTWSAPVLLQTAASAYALSPQLVMQPNGLAWAAWIERTIKDPFPGNDRFAVFAAKFDPASGWASPEKVTGDLQWRLDAKITTDTQGNPRIIVAWNAGVSGPPDQSTLYAARRLPAGGWAPLETLAVAVIAGGLSPDYSEYDMVVDANDNAVAVWKEYDGTRYLILTRHYTVAGGWEPTLGLQPSGPDSGFAPQITMDGNGNGFVAWHQARYQQSNNAAAYAIWVARFEKITGWTSLQFISSPVFTTGEDSTFPKILCDQMGNAVAIWTKNDFVRGAIVRANYYSQTNGWGSDETISNGPGVSWRPELAVSSMGYATAVWWQAGHDPLMPNNFQAFSASRAPAP